MYMCVESFNSSSKVNLDRMFLLQNHENVLTIDDIYPREDVSIKVGKPK